MTMNNRRTNPIASRVLPHQGQPLPSDFHQRPAPRSSLGSIQMDRRNWAEVFAAPRWSGKGQENLTQLARLSGPVQQQEPPQV
jgi:hypothetical protein